MSMIAEYGTLLKSRSNEEFFDLVLHRPLAYIIVKILQPTPVTANQVTFFSVLVCFAAAYCIAAPGMYFTAGMLMFAANIFDCVDGQLARLRGITSYYGRLADGAGDYVSSIAFFTGIALWQPPYPMNPLLWCGIVIASMFAFARQSALVDYYRNEYSHRLAGKSNFARKEFEQAETELENGVQNRANVFKLFALRFYYKYLSILQKSRPETNAAGAVPSEVYVRENARLFRLWVLNGTVTPRFLLMFCCFLDRPDFFVWYLLSVSVIATTLLNMAQQQNNRRLAQRYA